MKIGITERGDAGLNHAWRDNNCDGIILITKSPATLGKIPQNAIVHCTITGFGGTILEPGVAEPTKTLQAYHKILDEIGQERTVLRIDPIIPTEKGIATAQRIFAQAKGRTRISFIDNYPHVARRLQSAGLPALKTDGLHYPLSLRKSTAQLFPNAEICGEPGMPCTGCVSAKDIKALGLSLNITTIGNQRPACGCLTIKTELLTERKPCKHGCLYCYWK